jgi:hypothetical protein
VNHTKTVNVIVSLITLLIFLTINVSSAQANSSLKVDYVTLGSVLPANTVWEKTYGGAADDRAFFAVPAGDGYLAVGSSSSIVANATVGWVLKIDGDGNEVWNKTFLEGFGTELRYAVNLTDGFLLVGNQFMVSGDVNGFVAKIDNQGIIIWQTIIGEENIDKLFSGIITLDGFAVFGLTQSYDNNQSAAWVVRLDNDGKVIWYKTFGQTNPTILRSGVLAQDGDYVLAGYTDLSSGNNYDFYLLKVHPDSSMVWNKTYGGVQSEKAYSMTKAVDGYTLVGEIESRTSSTDAWVLKVDENGNNVWAKTVGGKDADSPAYVTTSKDGGYLVAGFTFSFGQGQRDFWLFKINDQGQIIFSLTQGDSGFQEAYCVIEKNNSYVMVGWTDPMGQPALIGKKMYDFYITELSVTPNGDGTLDLQLTDYVIIVFSILLFALFLMFKLRKKIRTILKFNLIRT